MVSAFVQANHRVFGQVKTDGKGQELSGIQKLLLSLFLKGAVVTIDALGCQKSIAQAIVDAEADYLLQVKENQPTLLAKLQTVFAEGRAGELRGHGERPCPNRGWGSRPHRDPQGVGDLGSQAAGGHRQGVAGAQEPGDGGTHARGQRQGVHGGALLHQFAGRPAKPAQFLAYTRGHWSVENNLHWQLDVCFAEDQRRIRKGYAAENFSRLCRMALNQLKREPTHKNGIAIRRLTCGWDNAYLLKVLTA